MNEDRISALEYANAELAKCLRGMHGLVKRREADARALIQKTRSNAELRRFVERCIIDGADACREFGPCPECAEAKRGATVHPADEPCPRCAVEPVEPGYTICRSCAEAEALTSQPGGTVTKGGG